MSARSFSLAVVILLLGGVRLYADQQFRVSAASANLRFDPDTSSAVVGRVERGNVLRVIAIEGNWVKVALASPGGLDKIGYIEASLGRIEEVQGNPPAPGQQPPFNQPPFNRREPVISLVLSLVFPGIGQLYNGPTEQHKGLIMIGAGVGSIAMTFIGATRTGCSVDIYSVSCGVSPLYYIGLLGYLGDTVYSAYDGYTRAEALNKQHGFAFQFRVAPEVAVGRTGVRAEAQWTKSF